MSIDIEEWKNILPFMSILTEGNPPISIRVHNDKELGQKFDSIIQGFSSAEDWQNRMKSLAIVQGLLIDGYCLQNDQVLLSFLRSNNEIFGQQASDLRSVVSREGCKTISMIATYMSGSFSLLAEIWLPIIIKQLQVKIQIISTSADNAIRVIIASAPLGYGKLIPIIVENILNSKSAPLRKFCLEYLCMICSLWSMDVLEKYFSSFKTVVNTSLSDADQLARKASRILFWTICNRVEWEGSMRNLMSNLDSSTQKHLQMELKSSQQELNTYSKYLNFRNNKSSSPITSIMFQHYLSTTPPSGQVNLPTKADSSVPLKSQSLTSIINGKASSSSTRSVSRMRAHTKEDNQQPTSHQAVVQSQPSRGPSRIDTTGIQKPVPSYQDQTMHPSNKAIVENTSTNTINDRRSTLMLPRRLVQKTSTDEIETTMMNKTTSIAAPISSSIQKSLELPPPPADHEQTTSVKRSMIVVDNIMPPPVNTIISTRGLTNGPLRVTMKALTVSDTHADEPMMNSSKTIKSTSTINEYSEESITCITTTSTISSMNLNIQQIRNEANDSLWSIRLKAFEDIHQYISQKHNDNEKLTSIEYELFLELAIHHIEDSNNKVSIEALQILKFFVNKFTSQTCYHLTQFLSILFCKLGDRRPYIRDEANELLNSIRQVYDGNTIIHALIPKILDVPERIRTAVIQFLGAILMKCIEYFLNTSNMLLFLKTIAIMFQTSNNNKPSTTLVRSSKKLLEEIYKISPNIMLQQINCLLLQQKETMKKLLESLIPNIDSLLGSQRIEWQSSASSTSSSSSISSSSSNTSKVDTNTTSNTNTSKRIKPIIGKEKESKKLISSDSQQSHVLNPINKDKVIEKVLENEMTPTLLVEVVDEEDVDVVIESEYESESKLEQSQQVQEAYEKEKENIDQLPMSIIEKNDTCNNITTPMKSASMISNPIIHSHWESESVAYETITNALQCQEILVSTRIEKFQCIRYLKKSMKNGNQSIWAHHGNELISLLLAPLEQYTTNTNTNANTNNSKMIHSFTGCSPISTSTSPNKQDDSIILIESMHLSCKAFSYLIKYMPMYAETQITIITKTMIHCSLYLPMAVNIHCEQILEELSKLNSIQFIQLVLVHLQEQDMKSMKDTIDSNSHDHDISNRILFCLHLLIASIKHISSNDLETIWLFTIEVISLFLDYHLADIRKSVIFIFVEAYNKLGNNMFHQLHTSMIHSTYIKLIHIYIDKLQLRKE